MFSFRGPLRPGDTFVRHRWPTVDYVSQLSFFSAESVPPAVADLTGILAAPGQVVLVGLGNDKPRDYLSSSIGCGAPRPSRR